jgi:chemotaxis response regulator CheB
MDGFPDDLPFAVFVVLHLSAHSRGELPRILERRGRHEIKHPSSGETIRAGRIYFSTEHFEKKGRAALHSAELARQLLVSGAEKSTDPTRDEP